ncbi:hypothetical protein WJX81_001631 [Elliptochloris bilobata]|uniref:Uncharacterized protein n=1 Tax=Elliptochloris bilobata TaxID=381761 RepID=A0AAW1R205_9CHLO
MHAQGICGETYLLAQNSVLPPMLACLAATLLAPLYSWLLVFCSGMGVHRAAVACDLISATNAALLFGYLVLRERRLAGTPQQTWQGWSRECWRGWGAYLRIAEPSITMTAGECSAAAMILLAGMLPDPQTAVDIMGISHVLSSGLFMVPMGLSGAVSARVANELGAGDGLRAQSAVRASAVLVVAVMLVFSTIVLALRQVYGWVFSEDAEVVTTLAQILVFVAVAIVGDGVNAVQSGVVRGARRQNWAAATNLLVYWVLGVPLAVWLASRLRLGVFGLWGGLVVIMCLQGMLMTVLESFFDWRLEASRACQLVG